MSGLGELAATGVAGPGWGQGRLAGAGEDGGDGGRGRGRPSRVSESGKRAVVCFFD
jgi:hypothetical protein